jgi:TRAP-type C4-dicarboxylate transport system permease small subunit
MLVIAALALYWSFETVAVSWKFGSVTDGLRVSKVWFLMAVPIGFGLVVFRLLQSLYRDYLDLMGGRPVFEGNKMFD